MYQLMFTSLVVSSDCRKRQVIKEEKVVYVNNAGNIPGLTHWYRPKHFNQRSRLLAKLMPRALNGDQKHDRPARSGRKGHKRTTHSPDMVARDFGLFIRITRQAMYV